MASTNPTLWNVTPIELEHQQQQQQQQGQEQNNENKINDNPNTSTPITSTQHKSGPFGMNTSASFYPATPVFLGGSAPGAGNPSGQPSVGLASSAGGLPHHLQHSRGIASTTTTTTRPFVFLNWRGSMWNLDSIGLLLFSFVCKYWIVDNCSQ